MTFLLLLALTYAVGCVAETQPWIAVLWLAVWAVYLTTTTRKVSTP
jgi:hypothetical protein